MECFCDFPRFLDESSTHFGLQKRDVQSADYWIQVPACMLVGVTHAMKSVDVLVITTKFECKKNETKNMSIMDWK